MHLPPLDSLTVIGGAIAAIGLTWLLCSIPFAVLIGRMIARGPYIDSDWDDFDDHCDTAQALANLDAEAAATAHREADALVAEAYRAMRSESA